MKKRIVVSLVVSSFLSIINFLLIVYLLVQTFYLIGLPNKEATSFPSNGFVPFIVFFSILILPLLFHVYIEIVLLKKSKTIKNVPNGFNKKMFWSSVPFLFALVAILLFFTILFFIKNEVLFMKINSLQEFLLFSLIAIIFVSYFIYCCILFNPVVAKRLNKEGE
jgi:hypothetical protein